MELQLIEKINESGLCCPIVAVLDTDSSNKEIATVIAVADPMGAGAASATSNMSLGDMIREMKGTDASQIRPIMKSIMNTMSELRLILPPVYNFDPKFFAVNKDTMKA